MKTKKTGHSVKTQIRMQGGPQLAEARVVARYSTLAAVEVSLKTKHCEIALFWEDDKGPALALDCPEQYLPARRPRRKPKGLTLVSFPEFAGWAIFCAECCRYTLRICFVKIF